MSPNLNKTLNHFTATKLASLISEAQCQPSDIIRDCFKRIKLRNPKVKAWKYINESKIEQQLDYLNQVKTLSPLSGIPMAIKDNFDTKDMPTEYGTSIYPDFRPQKDTEVIKILRNAGLIFLGKTITSEFAGPYPGPTLNPHALDRTPGVSSMGSAASVADFMVPISNGTQTGGSIIRPASLCGVFGYKGSFGHITGVGIKHLKPSIDTVGHFARCLEDIELLRQVLTNDLNSNSFFSINPPIRVGICKTSNWHAASIDTKIAIKKSIESLKTTDCILEEINLPPEFDKVMERSFQVIYSWELREAHKQEIKNHFESFNPWFKWAIKFLEDITFQDYQEALEEAKYTRSILKKIFREIDVIISPSAIGEAPKELMEIPKYSFNHLWTLMYVPCVNLPYFLGANGLPVGIQVIGPQNKDKQLLSYCNEIENKMKNYFGKLPVSTIS